MADNKYDELECNDPKVLGARMGVETMLYYYLTSLIDKVDDPKQYLARKLPVIIEMSEEQATYVGAAVKTDNQAVKSLSTVIALLKKLKDNYDEGTLSIAIEILENLHISFVDALEMYKEDNKPDEEAEDESHNDE